MRQRTIREQQSALNRFFRAEVKNLEAATEAVIFGNSRSLKRRSLQQLRRFRKGRQSNAGFFKAVKIYDLPAQDGKGPASYVRFGVPWIGVFQEGETIQGKPSLAVLLPSGEALGYRRVNPASGHPQNWDKVWARLRRDSENGEVSVINTPKGNLVAILKRGEYVGVYFFSKSVDLPKKLSVYEVAEQLSQSMGSEIIRLLELGDVGS